MKKVLIIAFILVDAVVIAVAALFLYSNVSGSHPALLKKITGSPDTKPAVSTPAPAASTPNSNPLTNPTATPDAASTIQPTPGVQGSANSRKILFTYRNTKAKKVMIRADFTGWRAEAMEKDPATSIWRYMAVLEPGEYAYCYSVDSKSIRDPANKQTKTVGKTVVSSIIVQPPTQ